MYCPSLSSSSFSASAPSAWNIDDMCPDCGRFCECADHFYTPPQSPAAANGFNLGNSPTTASAPSQSFANFIVGTPNYPDAPPSTPTTVHWPEHTLQLWSSNVYKSTINFPPSELPEHLRDGAWCNMQDLGEIAILFGPEAPIPFNWTTTGTTAQQSDDGSNSSSNILELPKYIWGPLDASQLVPRGNYGSNDSVESQVRDNIENTETRLNEVTALNNDGSSLDSGKLSNEVEA